MPYITQIEMASRFGEDELIELTDRNDLGAIDVSVLNDAIGDASNLIDSHLRRGYALPLTQSMVDSSPIKRHCGDIARYLLHDNGATDEVKNRYDQAVHWLRDIAAGKASLGEQDVQAASESRMTTGTGNSGTNWGSY